MKQQKNISLDIEVIHQIEKLAKKDNQQFSGYVNKVLVHHIEQMERAQALQSQSLDQGDEKDEQRRNRHDP